jgi:hypothetical protein
MCNCQQDITTIFIAKGIFRFEIHQQLSAGVKQNNVVTTQDASTVHTFMDL